MNKNKIISIIFIIVIFYFSIHASFSCLLSHCKTKQIPNNLSDQKVNWEKLYPFSTKINMSLKPANNYFKKNLTLIYFFNKIKTFTKKIDNSVTSRVPFRYKLCEVIGYFSKQLGVYYFPDLGCFIQKNKQLTLIRNNSANPSYVVNRISDFSKWLLSENEAIQFVYFQHPCKISKFDNSLPLGITDIRNNVSDTLLEGLKKNGINYLDLRELIEKQSLNFPELFLKTDHHWKTETGLWATNEICNYINHEFFNNTLDFSTLNNNLYIHHQIENHFLGSIGRKLTLGFVEPESLTLVYPKFETKLDIFSYKGQNSGSFYDVFIDNEEIKKQNINFYETDKYNFFKSYGAFYHIRNNLVKNNYKILFIVDSYNEVIIPFLSMVFKDVYVLSLRGFNGSIKTCVKNIKPNIVAIGYTARYIPEPDDFQDTNLRLYCFD